MATAENEKDGPHHNLRSFDSLPDAYSRVCHCPAFEGKASIVWDKFAKQAINRGRMNYLGRVGSDTGIRTRVSAVRGRRPRPLDDIANRKQKGNYIAGCGTNRNSLFSHERESPARVCGSGVSHTCNRCARGEGRIGTRLALWRKLELDHDGHVDE